MEKKNPFEEVRSAILASQLLGIENEVSELGISDELLDICDAIDDYYGIKKKPVTQYPSDTNDNNQIYKIFEVKPKQLFLTDYDKFEQLQSIDFAKDLNLLKRTEVQLKSIKRKLPEDNPIYIQISSAIASIAIRDVVSTINSYQRPITTYNLRTYDFLTGVDMLYSNIIYKGIDVFYELKKFDMTQDCYDVFQSNYNRISAICDKISDTILNPPSTKKNSSGCMVVAITLSTSIIASLCVLICILL